MAAALIFSKNKISFSCKGERRMIWKNKAKMCSLLLLPHFRSLSSGFFCTKTLIPHRHLFLPLTFFSAWPKKNIRKTKNCICGNNSTLLRKIQMSSSLEENVHLRASPNNPEECLWFCPEGRQLHNYIHSCVRSSITSHLQFLPVSSNSWSKLISLRLLSDGGGGALFSGVTCDE